MRFLKSGLLAVSSYSFDYFSRVHKIVHIIKTIHFDSSFINLSHYKIRIHSKILKGGRICSHRWLLSQISTLFEKKCSVTLEFSFHEINYFSF